LAESSRLVLAALSADLAPSSRINDDAGVIDKLAPWLDLAVA